MCCKETRCFGTQFRDVAALSMNQPVCSHIHSTPARTMLTFYSFHLLYIPPFLAYMRSWNLPLPAACRNHCNRASACQTIQLAEAS